MLAQNGKQSGRQGRGGYNEVEYHLSLPCLEYFIARKVRPVFEVYRQVFHVSAKKELVYTESEVKAKMLESEEELKYLKARNKILEKENKRLLARVQAVVEIKEQESDLKNSCFYYLVQNKLYHEWKDFHIDLCEKRILQRMERERKKRLAEISPLPF